MDHMKHFKKLMEKKKDNEIDPMYKDAKLSMLEALKNEMHGMMGNELKNGGMKKVEVAADSKEDLAHGLDKAKDLLEHAPDHEDAEEAGEDADEESHESPEEEHAEEKAEEEDGEGEDQDAASMIEDLVNHESSEGDLDDESIDKLVALLQSKKKMHGRI